MFKDLAARWFGWALVLGLAMGTAACNTTAGVGEDIESVGDSIEDAAEGAK